MWLGRRVIITKLKIFMRSVDNGEKNKQLNLVNFQLSLRAQSLKLDLMNFHSARSHHNVFCWETRKRTRAKVRLQIKSHLI